ncbi:SelB C-terminal domain-containing protein [Sulfitobacter sp. HNIBRBA3233]|uniref:selenocysteine-specific translation elongation factor n=1 Tax=Sulfitobacter marinivivus TaxID=3158558 RepID=UPI0032DEA59D
MTCSVVVIGHVDHGKTSLVRALTGRDTDRLEEERRRGLSIVPGFAHRSYAAGVVDFIDAPGHADFIHAMVRGASGARAVLLVVSVREGIAAQTREHLRIAELLGLSDGVVALTQCDGVDPDQIAACRDEVRAALAATAFADAPVLACSASEGSGLDDIHAAIGALSARPVRVDAPGHAFLPIDRVFTVQGRGVVVTGTLLGGPIATGDSLRIVPQNRDATARSLQSRGEPQDRVDPGGRVAVNLRGVDAGDLAAGDTLVAGADIAASDHWDVEVAVLDGATGLRHMQQLRVLIGTTAAVARLRLLDRPSEGLRPGARGLARLQFDRPQVAFAGQRAVLRHLSPAQTCGGLTVLDPSPPDLRLRDREAVLGAAQACDPVQIARAMAGQGPAPLTDIARLARQAPDTLWPLLRGHFLRVEPDLIVPRDALDAGKAGLLAALAAAHAERPLRAVVARRALGLAPDMLAVVERALQEDGAIRVEEAGLALCTHDPMAQMDAAARDCAERIEAHLREGGMSPPDLGALDGQEADILDLLLRDGRVVRLENVGLGQWILFHRDALVAAAQELRQAFPPPAVFRTGAARAALSTTRKFIVPVLEHFDRTGITLREGDARRMAP